MIKYVILIIIAILVLSFFGYDLQAIVESPLAQRNLDYAKSGVTFVWDEYLSQPLTYFWNNIFVGILWSAFTENLGRIHSGAPTELENAGKRLLDIGETGYTPIDR